MFKNRMMTLLILCSLIIGACKPNSEVRSSLSAVLSELTGTVDAKQAEESSFAPVTKDYVLNENGQIQTADDGRVRLDLSSGTIVRVSPSSIFTLTSNDEVEGGLATKIKLEIGKVFIILNGGSADVETPSGVASVRGSYMKVEVDPETGNVYVTCLEGNCSATNPAGTVNFGAGERTILFQQDPATGNWTLPIVEPMTPEEFQEWLDENPEAQELFNQAMSTMTALAEPTEPSATEPAATATEVPATEESNACFQIIQPANGSSLPGMGRIAFEWETQPGAQKYIVTFTDQNGYRGIIETTETSMEKFIEILPNGGDYSWAVTSYGEDGNEICTTESASFSKPASEPTPKPTKVKEDKPDEPKDPEATAPPCDPYMYYCP
ncbi:MAG: FecR domain-containing protein [Anaerolineales bacterium]|nr:FecR domain-containing protein [Anaerolineales bacterium]